MPLIGFAGGAADALALSERLEAKLDDAPRQRAPGRRRAGQEWRTDRALRRLEAMLLVGDAERMLMVSGNGDVIEPDDGIAAIGSGGAYALAAARALLAPHGSSAGEIAARGAAASRPRSASTPTIDIYAGRRCRERAAQTFTPREIVSELDRYIVGQARGEARGRHRAAQSLAPPAGAGGAARRDRAEEHHHDRADRRREDGDRAAAGEAGPGAVHQGRGVEVHRGRLRRARRRVDRPRPDGDSASRWCSRRRSARCRQRPRSAPRSACSTRCCRRPVPQPPGRSGSGRPGMRRPSRPAGPRDAREAAASMLRRARSTSARSTSSLTRTAGRRPRSRSSRPRVSRRWACSSRTCSAACCRSRRAAGA